MSFSWGSNKYKYLYKLTTKIGQDLGNTHFKYIFIYILATAFGFKST